MTAVSADIWHVVECFVPVPGPSLATALQPVFYEYWGGMEPDFATIFLAKCESFWGTVWNFCHFKHSLHCFVSEHLLYNGLLMNDLPERNQDEQKEEKDIMGHFSLFGGATCEQSLWKKQLFALISNAIHPHTTHIFTLFLSTFKRNKCLSSIPCYFGIPSFSSIPSYLPFPPLSPSPYQSERVCLCVSGCNCGHFLRRSVWAQWRWFVVGVFHTMLTSKSFFRTLHALVLSCCMGPNQRGSFCIARL